ncbi:MAG: TetR/AcrR family transcriptional regulator [Desulfomonilia bacterium]|nr:TetR/AcrR family transcriptional regulator [Desulfomonilia bacterium]
MGSKERRHREKQRRRKSILDTARDLLFKKGIDATTMNQIARNAELSVGTLYLYFKNKEDLYAALQEEGLDILFENIKAVHEKELPPGEKLMEMALEYLDFSEKHRTYYEIINYFLASPKVVFPVHLKERIDEHGDRILSLVEGVVKDLVENDSLDERTLRRKSIFYWSNLHGMLQFRKLQNTILKREPFREFYLSIVSCVLQVLGQSGPKNPREEKEHPGE